MKRTIELFDSVLFKMMSIFTITISTSMLVVKAMYKFDDSPYFTWNSILDILIFIGAVVFLAIFIKHLDVIENKINIRKVTIVYIVISVSFIALVPLKLFSDMEQVYNGAISISNLDFESIINSEYLQSFKGNIKLSLLYGIIMMMLPRSVWTLKLLNIVLNIGTSYCLMKSLKKMGLKYSKISYIVSLFFTPAFLYLNHIYFDNFITFITTLTFYIYIKNKDNISIVLIILAIASVIRLNCLVLILAYIIDYSLYYKLEKKKMKQCLLGILVGISFFVLSESLVKSNFYNDNIKGYSGWNQFYIGINEKEFGFMDGDFDKNRCFEDVLDRYKDYGLVKVSTIMTKKFFWTWGEGTYQASRYSFGENENDFKEKFYYYSPILKYLMINDQFTRKLIDSVCRTEYILMFFGMTIFVIKNHLKDFDKFRIIYLMFIGTLVILLFYEMKSRYICNLYPFMILLFIAALSYNKENQKKYLC